MYVPPHFQETDRTKLFDFIERHSFGLLISNLHGEPFASHLPLLVDRHAGDSGTLVGHMARANPQWTATDRGVLAVFSGPHAYISPTWYESTDVVPTWNYVAVHVYGTLKIEEDHAATIQIVRDYVAFYERSMPQPWQMPQPGQIPQPASADGAKDYIDKMARAVVGFRVAIERIEGKWKLNQNHPRERREKVAQALAQRSDENSQAISSLMAAALRQPGAGQ
jgi:transcriptional regulator